MAVTRETRAAFLARLDGSSRGDRWEREFAALLASGQNNDNSAYGLPIDPSLIGPVVFKSFATTAVTAGTGITIWTPASGKKVRLMGWSISLSVAGQLLFADNVVGSVFQRSELLAAAGVSQTPPGYWNGNLLALANNVLKLDVSASGNVAGFVFGTED